MLTSSPIRYADLISDLGLLTSERQEELVSRMYPQCRDWNILLSELVYREWLTPFQATMLAKGKGRDLRLGSYILQEPLGEGGTGRIFRAEHAKLRTPAALKILRRSQARNPVAVSRFLREIRALAALRHPHVVHAFDADYGGGRVYCVMEYVPGTDLGHVVRQQGVLPWEVAARYAYQIALALQYVSSVGLIHRDIKPNNIQVTPDGRAIKLLDLGLARFERWELNEEDAGVTRVGTMIGTPNYISPEQIRDSRSADIRSDLYGLGCTLYFMLTGRAPFESADAVTALRKQLVEEAVPVEAIRPDIPPPLAAIVRTLMQKRPRDRHQYPAETVAALHPLVTPAGDTINDAASTTCTGMPVVTPDAAAGERTAEFQLHDLDVLDQSSVDLRSRKERVYAVLGKMHWAIAMLIAGIALGFVMRGQ